MSEESHKSRIQLLEEKVEALVDINVKMCQLISSASIGLIHSSHIDRAIKELTGLKER